MYLAGEGEARGLREYYQVYGAAGEGGEAGEAAQRGVRSEQAAGELVVQLCAAFACMYRHVVYTAFKKNLQLQHHTKRRPCIAKSTLHVPHALLTQIQNLHLALPPPPPLPPLQHRPPIPRRTLHIHICPRARQTIPQHDLALLLLLCFPSRRWR